MNRLFDKLVLGIVGMHRLLYVGVLVVLGLMWFGLYIGVEYGLTGEIYSYKGTLLGMLSSLPMLMLYVSLFVSGYVMWVVYRSADRKRDLAVYWKLLGFGFVLSGVVFVPAFVDLGSYLNKVFALLLVSFVVYIGYGVVVFRDSIEWTSNFRICGLYRLAGLLVGLYLVLSKLVTDVVWYFTTWDPWFWGMLPAGVLLVVFVWAVRRYRELVEVGGCV